jgi:cell division protein FtsW (lipid II flippase)
MDAGSFARYRASPMLRTVFVGLTSFGAVLAVSAAAALILSGVSGVLMFLRDNLGAGLVVVLSVSVIVWLWNMRPQQLRVSPSTYGGLVFVAIVILFFAALQLVPSVKPTLSTEGSEPCVGATYNAARCLAWLDDQPRPGYEGGLND